MNIHCFTQYTRQIKQYLTKNKKFFFITLINFICILLINKRKSYLKLNKIQKIHFMCIYIIVTYYTTIIV